MVRYKSYQGRGLAAWAQRGSFIGRGRKLKGRGEIDRGRGIGRYIKEELNVG